MPGTIDDWLPEFDVGERHDVALAVGPEHALELALTAPAAPDRVVAVLFAARGIAARGESIEEFLHRLGFETLARTPTEWVAALDRRAIRVVVGFRAARMPAGSRLTTETRVRAAGERARRAFRLYWLLIGPFSALIRRRWLRAAQASARS